MKIECNVRPNRMFAPQLVGLISSLDKKGRPNVATLAWITTVGDVFYDGRGGCGFEELIA